MNAAKLRECYQQTQLLLSELQALGSDSYGKERANSKHQQLARLAVQLQLGTETLPEQDLRAIWKERSAKLHEDLVSLTALRLQREGESGEQFWDGCVRLLYAGASAYIQRETELVSLQSQQSSYEGKRASLEASLETCTQQREATAKENLELRTRVVVLQQEVQRRDADARDLQQQVQPVVRERDALRSERDKLLLDCERNNQALERQAKVIGQLMERSECSVKERDEAVSTLKQVDEDNHVLRVNLHQHTLVVEKLIGLNTEVMDTLNKSAIIREKLEKLLAEKTDSEQNSDGNSGLRKDGTEGHAENHNVGNHNVENLLEDDDHFPISTLPEISLPLSTHPHGDNMSEKEGVSPSSASSSYSGGFNRGFSWRSRPVNVDDEKGGKRTSGSGVVREENAREERVRGVEEERNGSGTSTVDSPKGGAQSNAREIRPSESSVVICDEREQRDERNHQKDGEERREGEGRSEGEEREERARDSRGSGVAKGAKNMLKSVGGRAIGFLSYVAGADKAGSEEQKPT